MHDPNRYGDLRRLNKKIYTFKCLQGSPKVGDVFTDYDWDLERFVEYNSPLKAILSPDNNSSHWNRKNNSPVMTNNHSPRRDETKNQIKR